MCEIATFRIKAKRFFLFLVCLTCLFVHTFRLFVDFVCSFGLSVQFNCLFLVIVWEVYKVNNLAKLKRHTSRVLRFGSKKFGPN